MEINQKLHPITAVSLKQVEVTVMEVIAVMLRSLVKKWRRASVRLITNTYFLVSWLKSRRVPVVSEA